MARGIERQEEKRKVGLQLKRQRKLAGLTQARLGEMIGCEPVMISYYETGYRMPKVETLINIAQVLKIDAGVFLEDFDYRDAVKRSRRDFDIIEQLNRCSEQQKRHLRKYVELLREDFPVEDE